MESSESSEWLPKVSVVVPCYNNDSTVEGALQALKAQDYKGWMEVIVVDDGSTDGSAEIAQPYADKVIVQSNRGAGMARNRGAEEAEGEVLVFTDADCVATPQFISEMVKPLSDPTVAGVQGKYLGGDQALISRFIQHESDERARRKGRVENVYWVGSHSVSFRRDVFSRMGGFSRLVRAQDFDLSQRMVESGYRIVFNDNAILYHHHPTSLGKYIKGKYVRAFWMIAIYKKYPQRIVNDPITPPLRKWMMVFLTLGVVSIPFAFLWQFLWWFVLANWVLVFLSTLPFTVRTLVRDPVVGLVAPWIMILRSAVFVVGFAAGFCAYMSKRDFDEVFYQKVE